MANEIRLRNNNISGTITDNPLAIGATTINAAGFADLPAVGSTEHLILILDPQEVGGTAEIVRVTAHTASSTSVTVQRGQEGSTARSHVFGTTWMHGPTVKDFDNNSGSDSFVTSAYAQAVVDQGSITTSVDLTSLTVTVLVPANRRLRITGSIHASNTGAGNQMVLRINEGGTQFNSAALTSGAVSTIERMTVIAVITPTAGSHTYKLVADTGAGTMTASATSTRPNFILVEDLGAAS